MAINNQNVPLFSVPVVEVPSGAVTQYWRDFFTRIWQITRTMGIGAGWVAPTGAGSRATFNMDAAFPVSNPPTQAEVVAIRDQLIIVQKRLGQLIEDQLDAGTIAT